MALYRWETHAHTAEGSACGRSSAAEMVRGAAAAGYDGIFITDHFYHGNTRPDRRLPWDRWVQEFRAGYEHARETGNNLGITVLFGWEYSWKGNDFLTYGLSPEWLAAHPETVTFTAPEYLRLVRDAGAFIVHAHPFRQADYIEAIRLVPESVDAVEVYNGGNRTPAENERAKWYAESYALPQTSGSDTHFRADFTGGIITERLITSAADYADAVLHGGITALLPEYGP
ncbi:MAG: histidinol-phosphatase [Oscillospiraceae bacterium]|nr:histidinol-phosphatase [Oscillospiraceae bacterium]